jgi:thiol-disulfide isomerase/thioredoxin
MKKLVTQILPLLFFLLLLSAPAAANPSIESAPSDEVRTINVSELEKIISSNSDTVYLINFWATWCVPCVEELPYFEQINQTYAGKKVKVLLVSLDYPQHLDTRVEPFLEKHDIQSEVVLLDEKDPNDWVPRLSSEWQGSIPATFVIYNPKNVRQFYEQEFTYTELETIIKDLIKS